MAKEKDGMTYRRYSGIFDPPINTNDNCISGHVIIHSIGRAKSSVKLPRRRHAHMFKVPWSRWLWNGRENEFPESCSSICSPAIGKS